MKKLCEISFWVIMLSMLLPACGKKVKQTSDQLYSRHLQRSVQLSIISTPIPKDKSTMSLLIVNDGQDMEEFGMKKIVDSLWKKNRLAPLLVVGIHAGDRMQEYGIAGLPDFQNRGSKADKYAAFINNELYPFVKKKTGMRSFKNVVIAGCSMGGLSAFDIAWNNAARFNKVGVFSGSFWWRNKDISDPSYSDSLNRIVLNMIRSSRKRPDLKMWFYVGDKEETSDRDHDGIIDAVDDTRDLIKTLAQKKSVVTGDITVEESPLGMHDYPSWRKALPDFLIWAFESKN